MVSISRCGRDDPGSIPGFSTHIFALFALASVTTTSLRNVWSWRRAKRVVLYFFLSVFFFISVVVCYKSFTKRAQGKRGVFLLVIDPRAGVAGGPESTEFGVGSITTPRKILMGQELNGGHTNLLPSAWIHVQVVAVVGGCP